MSATTAATCRSRWIDRRPRAHDRVAPAAGMRGLHVVAALAAVARRSRDDVGEHEHERARDVVGAREVGGVVRARSARRRARARCSSSAASAARRRRGCWPGSRRPRAAARGRRSGGARARPRRAGGWSRSAAPRSFSHQRKAGMSSLLPCSRPPGRRRSARTSRSPTLEPVRRLAQPARHRRRVAVAHGAPQHLVRQPVDLQNTMPGTSERSRRRAAAPGGGRRCAASARRRRWPAAPRPAR